MARRQWFDTPVTDSPFSAALLNDLETRKMEADYHSINVKDAPYSAVGDAVADDRLAIQTAINALPESGGELVFPRGTYLIGSQLSFNSRLRISLRGQAPAAGMAGGGTVLMFTGTGAVDAFTASSAQGLSCENISFLYNSGAFTGHLWDLRGSVPSNTMRLSFRNCYFGSQPTSISSAASLFRTQLSHTVSFDSCSFFGATNAVWGQETGSGVDCPNYCFRSCLFQGFASFTIRNPASSWSFVACSFEPKTNGEAGAIYSESDTVPFGGLSLLGCWFGDVTLANGEWIRMTGHGLFMAGCAMNYEQPSAAVRLNANDSRGVVLVGNCFQGSGGGSTALDFQSTTGHAGVVMMGNRYLSTTDTAGTQPTDYMRMLNDGMFRYGGRLICTNGYASGGHSAATTPGSVVKKLPIYDTDGSSLLGYIPIYSTIT